MPGLISDAVLRECAVWGPPEEVAAALRAEYAGTVDRLATYEALVPNRRTDIWRTLLDGLRAGG